MRQPYFKESRNTWYYDDDSRKQHSLGVKGKENKEAAFEKFYVIKAAHEPVTVKTKVVHLIEQFLDHTKENKDALTYEWYERHLQRFATFIGSRLAISELKPAHVNRWIERSYKGHGDTYKNGACRAVNRVFNWAAGESMIPYNPVRHMNRPAYQPCKDFISQDQWDAIVKVLDADSPLGELLWFMHETGCRPFEAAQVEARHYDKVTSNIVFSPAESKGKKAERTIRLNADAALLFKKLMLRRPTGPVLLCPASKKWTRFSMRDECVKLTAAAGFRVTPKLLRHGFCTEALKRGLNVKALSLLMGHTTPIMVLTNYSHLIDDDVYLKQALRQALGGPAVAPASDASEAG